MKAGADIEPGKSNGACIEAVVQNGSEPGVPKGALRIYFGGCCDMRKDFNGLWGLVSSISFSIHVVNFPRSYRRQSLYQRNDGEIAPAQYFPQVKRSQPY